MDSLFDLIGSKMLGLLLVLYGVVVLLGEFGIITTAVVHLTLPIFLIIAGLKTLLVDK